MVTIDYKDRGKGVIERHWCYSRCLRIDWCGFALPTERAVTTKTGPQWPLEGTVVSVKSVW